MMKIVLFQKSFSIFLLIIIINSAKSQTHSGILPHKDSEVVYSDVIQLDSGSINLHENAELYFKKSCNEYNATIQLETNKLKNYIIEDDSIQIIANIRFVVQQNFGRSDYEALLTIEIKPKKYRYTITDFKMTYNSGASMIIGGAGQGYVPLEKIDIPKEKNYIIKIDKAIKNQIQLLTKTMTIQKTGF